ncbi:MAG: hypothetical protein MZV70_15180 [Desulfobacterales bacterium]|nr:hypothetical protein [Desulfobacterales bacterium]
MLDRMQSKIDGGGRTALPSSSTARPKGADTLIVAYGVTARAAGAAARELASQGRPVSLLVLKTLWPVPAAAIRRAAGDVRRVAGGRDEPGPVRARNRTRPAGPDGRLLRPDGRAADRAGNDRGGRHPWIALLNAARPPVFCPGCSHERITHTLDKAFRQHGAQRRAHRHGERHRLLGAVRHLLPHPRLPRPARPGAHLCGRDQARPARAHGGGHHGRRRPGHRRGPPAGGLPPQPGPDAAGPEQFQLRHDRRPVLRHHPARRRGGLGLPQPAWSGPWTSASVAKAAGAPVRGALLGLPQRHLPR